MVVQRTGRSFPLYFLFALFSAAWLSTVFLYYGSFAPSDPGRHTPSLYQHLSNHQHTLTIGDSPLAITETARAIEQELRKPISTDLERRRNAEKAPPIELHVVKDTLSDTNDSSDPSKLASMDVGTIKSSSAIAAEKPKDLPDLSLNPNVEKRGNEEDAMIAPLKELKDPPTASSTFRRSTTVIMILACKRAHYLEQTLNSLMRLDGVGEYNIIISQDGHDHGVRDLAASFVNRHPNIRQAHSPRSRSRAYRKLVRPSVNRRRCG
jgi:hypothetical protein